jgi:hydroxymethylpyrimidine pyrophosphatase-like HAD family hydrolase
MENRKIEQVVLFDVDKTLIDMNYMLTCPLEDFKGAISKAQKRGVLCGLSSDSALATLQKKRELYGMNGPIVFERGAGIWLPSGNVLDTSKDTSLFTETLKNLSASHLNPDDNDFLTLRGDVNSLLKDDYFLSKIFDGHKAAIFINGLRTKSLGLWVKSKDEILTKDILQRILDKLLNYFNKNCPQLQLDIDLNLEYGVLIIHLETTRKKDATESILKEYDVPEMHMVGDSMNDYAGDKAVHHAVENASMDYKSICRIVSKNKITQGAIDILNRI